MTLIRLILPGLGGLALLGACTSTPGMRGAPMTPQAGPQQARACPAQGTVTEAEVIGFEGQSVVVRGPDGPYNVSSAYLTEQPRIGDVLRIEQEYDRETCRPVAYSPAYTTPR